MKKILLPTDFSENSLNAIRYAVQLFKNEKCVFYILNTYTPTIKTGVVEGARIAKINELVRIEHFLGNKAKMANLKTL